MNARTRLYELANLVAFALLVAATIVLVNLIGG